MCRPFRGSRLRCGKSHRFRGGLRFFVPSGLPTTLSAQILPNFAGAILKKGRPNQAASRDIQGLEAYGTC